MALREEFEDVGNWLFRWRSYLPLLLVGLVALGLKENQARDFVPPLGWTLLCLAVSLAGLAVRVATIGFTPKGTSGRNTDGQRAEELNTSGIYATVRHPLYLGNFLMWIGIAMYCQIWWLVVIFALLFWIYYERIMFAEEEFLRRKFGESYVKWAAQTPAFWPRPWQYRAAKLPFSLRNVLKREYSGLLAIVAAFGALELAQHWLVEGRLRIDPAWQAIVAAGVIAYVALRTIRKRSTLLQVEGR